MAGFSLSPDEQRNVDKFQANVSLKKEMLRTKLEKRRVNKMEKLRNPGNQQPRNKADTRPPMRNKGKKMNESKNKSKKNNKTTGNKTINQINQSEIYMVNHTNNTSDLGQPSPSRNTGPGNRGSSNYRQGGFHAWDNRPGPDKPGPYYEDCNSNRYYGRNYDKAPIQQPGRGREDAQNRDQTRYGPGDRPSYVQTSPPLDLQYAPEEDLNPSVVLNLLKLLLRADPCRPV